MLTARAVLDNEMGAKLYAFLDANTPDASVDDFEVNNKFTELYMKNRDSSICMEVIDLYEKTVGGDEVTWDWMGFGDLDATIQGASTGNETSCKELMSHIIDSVVVKMLL